MDDDLNFEYGQGTDVAGGCGASLMGEMWYFGGYPNTRQVRLYYDSYKGSKNKTFCWREIFFLKFRNHTFHTFLSHSMF